MYHTSLEAPGLRPRRRDTLNSGPPSLSLSPSHRAIPMRAAQISSALHSVFQARQQLLFTSARPPRPLLPAPAAKVSRPVPPTRPSSPPLAAPRSTQVGDALSRSSTPSEPAAMLVREHRSLSRPTASHSKDDPRTQSRSSRAMGPPEERSSSRTRNPTDADWNQYRSIITSLYWDENLSMPVVRDYMKREHGFEATPRAYKFRFRKWGLRKNIKEHEALEIVSGQRNPNEFWAGTKRVNFERRIARHLEKEGQEVERLSKADLASLASRLSSTGGGPRRMSAPALYEGLESSLYDVNEWLAENRHREDWFSQRLDLGADEHFFPLFTRGLSLLARGDLAQQPTAWHTINRAFDHVRGLIASHHPVVYLRLVGRAAAFKYYPDAPICLDVCRLLLQHAYALFTEMHPTCHLLQAIWQTQMRTLRGTPRGPAAGSMEHSINVVTSLCASQWGDSREAWYMGALCIERYVPSAARGQDEDGLRATLLLEGNSNSNSNSNNNNNSASLDMDVLLSPLSISLAQEARLALGELLIGQERLAEGQRLVEEALAYRDLDVVQTEGKLFWMAELEWRMGHQDASISLLEETLAVLDAVALAQAQEGEAPGAYSSSSSSLTSSSSSSSSSLSALHVLGIMAHRLNIMGRRDYGSAARQRLSCLLNETQRECEYPFTLHLVRFDFEVEMDPEAVKKVLEGI